MTPARKGLLPLIGLVAGAIVTWYITNTMFDGSTEKMTATATWENILLVNVLVGACILLFVVELKRQAIRVLLTVIVALLLGFLVTFIFKFGLCRPLQQWRIPCASGFPTRRILISTMST